MPKLELITDDDQAMDGIEKLAGSLVLYANSCLKHGMSILVVGPEPKVHVACVIDGLLSMVQRIQDEVRNAAENT